MMHETLQADFFLDLFQTAIRNGHIKNAADMFPYWAGLMNEAAWTPAERLKLCFLKRHFRPIFVEDDHEKPLLLQASCLFHYTASDKARKVFFTYFNRRIRIPRRTLCPYGMRYTTQAGAPYIFSS